MVIASYVNYETTLHDHTHKGNRQAGNKSLLAFRADVGIPGYTGFIPIVNCVRVEGKTAQHTGKVATTELRDEALRATTQNPRSESLYKAIYTLKDGDVRPRDQTGGGYWIKTHRQIDPTYKLRGATTYQAEIDDSENHARAQTLRTDGLTMTISAYEAARQRAASARETLGPGALAVDPLTRTWHQDLGKTADPRATVGYTTEYASMVLNNPLVGGRAAAGRPHTVPVDSGHAARPKVAPRGLVPRAEGSTTYHVNFGRLGEDPAVRWGEAQKKFIAPTTLHLDIGSTRCSDHVPGYSGFVPVNMAPKVDPRPDAKAEALPLHLGQYSRAILPGCGINKPREATNVRLDQAPTTQTAYGHENAATLRLAAATNVNGLDPRHALSSQAGTLGFFTGGGEFVSDNGKNEAEKFYGITVRPLGGLPSVGHPSKTTVYGRKFTA